MSNFWHHGFSQIDKKHWASSRCCIICSKEPCQRLLCLLCDPTNTKILDPQLQPPLPKEPDLRPLCERGNHQTMGGVTRAGGDGTCRRPGLAQRPTGPDDYMGLVIAPLLEMEFFSMPEPRKGVLQELKVGG